MTFQPLDARAIAERGAAIYRQKYLEEYERKWRGRFAAIDINTELAYVADYPEQALAEARRAAPDGLFYLIRIGFPGAFKTARIVLDADTGVV